MAERRFRHYWGECTGCLGDGHLLPVSIYPGFVGPDTPVAVRLCLPCRLGWRDDQWACFATTIQHSAYRAQGVGQ